jgi:hemolysin activation/secretion protein
MSMNIQTFFSKTDLTLPILVVGMVGLCSAGAWAQLIPDAGRLLNDVQKSERESNLRTAPVEVIEERAPRPAISLPEGAQVPVTRFRITGNKSFGREPLDELVKPWEGRTLDVNGLNDAAGAITRHYQSRGFLLAYAYLPAQKVEQGVIEIAVLEGTVDAVQVVTAQDVRLTDEVIQQHVEGVTQSSQVLQADLERRLLLLNDIPGVVARASFTPGARPGTADVVVTVVEEEPLVQSVEFNNQGSGSTGEFRLGAQLHFRNIFGVGDSTRLHLQASQGGELVSGSLGTRVPLGGKGWSAEASVSHLTYELGEPYASLGARGEANALRLGLNYQLRRSMNSNISLTGSYDFKDLSDVLEFISSNKKHSHQFSLGMNASQQDEWLGGGSVQATLGATTGSLDWDSGNVLGQNAASHFTKVSYDFSRTQALVSDWHGSFRLTGQHALDTLDSSEKFSLTGPFGVRAYAPGQANVDLGSVLALELSRAWVLNGRTVAGRVFYDAGIGQYSVDPTPNIQNYIKLQGIGLGLNWTNGGDTEMGVTAAWRGRRQMSVDADRRPYIYFQVKKGF